CRQRAWGSGRHRYLLESIGGRVSENLNTTTHTKKSNWKMSLEEQIGQLLCCGYQDEAHAVRLIDELQVGGLILFSRNAQPIPELAATIERFQERATTPLLIGIDQEGGVVVRLEQPGMVFPGNMALGALGDTAASTAVG